MALTKYNKFDSKKVSFSPVKVVPFGGGNNRKLVYLNYDNRPFQLQTPELKLPFNLNIDQVTDDAGNSTGSEKYSFVLSFGNVKEDEELQKFISVFESINDLVKKECNKNSLSWLKKKNASSTEIDVLYNDHIKKYKDKDTGECTGKFADTFKVKVPYYDGKFACHLFDSDRKAIEDVKTSLVKSAKGKFIIQCNGVYFASGKFGLSWKLVQAKIDIPPSLDVCLFSDDDDVEDLNEQLLVTSDDEKDSEDDTVEKDEDEDDLDNEVSSSDEEEAPPPPPPKKTKRKKNT
tara:strand:+ start:336 stop:1205 length:870 start_codon:yes stop_codon:yes gene_type:complete